MVEVYLNLNGNSAEAAHYYAEAFKAEAPYLMRFTDMPKEDQESSPPGMENLVIYGHVKTFAGDIMLSDELPGNTVSPTSAVWITVSHPDAGKIRAAFEALARDGEILMPLEETFFSPLYGQLRDKFGFHWMFMLPSPL